MKDSKILKMARERIDREQSATLCSALIAAGYPSSPAQTDKLIDWVYAMLDDSDYLAKWLAVRHNIHVKDLFNGPIRDLRLRWLNWMIQYCKLEEAGWTPWLGGETPPKTWSQAMMRESGILDYDGSNIRWAHIDCVGDIIAYKP